MEKLLNTIIWNQQSWLDKEIIIWISNDIIANGLVAVGVVLLVMGCCILFAYCILICCFQRAEKLLSNCILFAYSVPIWCLQRAKRLLNNCKSAVKFIAVGSLLGFVFIVIIIIVLIKYFISSLMDAVISSISSVAATLNPFNLLKKLWPWS